MPSVAIEFGRDDCDWLVISDIGTFTNGLVIFPTIPSVPCGPAWFTYPVSRGSVFGSVSVLSADVWFLLEPRLLCSERFRIVSVKYFLAKKNIRQEDLQTW